MIERDELFRVKTSATPGTLARLLAAVGQQGANVGEIETTFMGPDFNIRAVTVIAPSDDSLAAITAAMRAVDGVEILGDSVDRVFESHRGGKLQVIPTVEVRTLQDMREVYTPGVARVSNAIAADPSLAMDLTWKGNTVAIITDGSRVLGLGNIGAEASLPVMEGKSMFYSLFAGLNAVPIVLASQDPADIIHTTLNIAPGFAAIHLEDIATPGVYEVERQLEEALDIPVFHDDQHGTATVVMGAIVRAAQIAGRPIETLTFGQVGLGAAGSAIALLATEFPFKQVLAYDPQAVAVDRVVELTRDDRPMQAFSGDATEMDKVIDNADVLVMTTGKANLLDPSRVRKGQIILALTNPVAEISRNDALAAGAAVAADGALVNNVLAYPGLMRGAIDAGSQEITGPMKRAAAETLAALAPDDQLLPEPLDAKVHHAVAAACKKAASEND